MVWGRARVGGVSVVAGHGGRARCTWQWPKSSQEWPRPALPRPPARTPTPQSPSTPQRAPRPRTLVVGGAAAIQVTVHAMHLPWVVAPALLHRGLHVVVAWSRAWGWGGGWMMCHRGARRAAVDSRSPAALPCLRPPLMPGPRRTVEHDGGLGGVYDQAAQHHWVLILHGLQGRAGQGRAGQAAGDAAEKGGCRHRHAPRSSASAAPCCGPTCASLTSQPIDSSRRSRSLAPRKHSSCIEGSAETVLGDGGREGARHIRHIGVQSAAQPAGSRQTSPCLPATTAPLT